MINTQIIYLHRRITMSTSKFAIFCYILYLNYFYSPKKTHKDKKDQTNFIKYIKKILYLLLYRDVNINNYLNK